MLKTAKSFLRMKASVTANPARSSASDAETIKEIRRPCTNTADAQQELLGSFYRAWKFYNGNIKVKTTIT